MKLSPYDPLRYLLEHAIAAAKLSVGQNEAALAAALRSLEANPNFTPALIDVALGQIRLEREGEDWMNP